MSENVRILKMMVRGAYDLQALRIQSGLRLCANFRAKLEPEASGELDEEGEKIVDQLKLSYRRLTDGVARNRSLPSEKGFEGDELISTFAELVLVDQYVRLEQQEVKAFSQMVSVLDSIPVYSAYLKGVTGVGPAMAGVLISSLDPHKARHVSSFWRYAGLDVGPDGRGRSRRAEHLVERTYTDKNGKEATRQGVTYNPFLKTKLMGVLAGSFLRSGSSWREVYDNYKHRLETNDAVQKVTLAEWKKRNTAGDDISGLWPPGRIHTASARYMVKMFLADLWANWRTLEGLPVTETYQEAKLGHRHKAA
jgi:hypothetical protein